MESKKKIARYTKFVIKDEISNDPGLSMEAKGLLLYIAGKPANWAFSAERMVKDLWSCESRIKKIRRELERYRDSEGNAILTKWRIPWQKAGQFGGWNYFLNCSPSGKIAPVEKAPVEKAPVEIYPIKKENDGELFHIEKTYWNGVDKKKNLFTTAKAAKKKLTHAQILAQQAKIDEETNREKAEEAKALEFERKWLLYTQSNPWSKEKCRELAETVAKTARPDLSVGREAYVKGLRMRIARNVLSGETKMTIEWVTINF